MRAHNKEALILLEQDLIEQLAEAREEQKQALAYIPTARNTMRETRESLASKVLGIESKLRQARSLIAFLTSIEEIRRHPRVTTCVVIDLWMLTKPGQDAILGNRGWRVDLVLTDGSQHQVSIGDVRVSHQDVVDSLMEALDDIP